MFICRKESKISELLQIIPGKRFVITGTLPVLRKVAVDRLTACGGIYQHSVSRKTDILIIGDLRSESSKKLHTAEALCEAGSGPLLIRFGDES